MRLDTERRSPLRPWLETCSRSPRTCTEICGKFETNIAKEFAEERKANTQKHPKQISEVVRTSARRRQGKSILTP